MTEQRGVPKRLVEEWAWRKLAEIRATGCTDVEGDLSFDGDAGKLEIKAVLPLQIQTIEFTGTLVLDGKTAP